MSCDPNGMTPAGYLYKQVVTKPSCLKRKNIRAIYSLSGCISENFTVYPHAWRHNGYWLFDSPILLEELAQSFSIDLSQWTLFYYEVYGHEFNVEAKAWMPFAADSAFPTHVLVPQKKTLAGYDVVTFSAGTMPECSPLSCNLLANDFSVNRYCLYKTFSAAKSAVENGIFDNAEPGPLRIFAVYTLG